MCWDFENKLWRKNFEPVGSNQLVTPVYIRRSAHPHFTAGRWRRLSYSRSKFAFWTNTYSQLTAWLATTEALSTIMSRTLMLRWTDFIASVVYCLFQQQEHETWRRVGLILVFLSHIITTHRCTESSDYSNKATTTLVSIISFYADFTRNCSLRSKNIGRRFVSAILTKIRTLADL